MFLTLVTTNITVITIGGHKSVRAVTAKAQVLLQLLRPEEDYQLVSLTHISNTLSTNQ
jgi:hypothetical protein